MSSLTIATGRTWTAGETVTPSRLNETVNAATLNFTATKKLAARVSAGAGVAEEADFGTAGQAAAAAETQAQLRTAAGLGSLATQAANAVALTGGSAALDVYHANPNALTYGTSVALDFSTSARTVQTIALAGNLELTATNLGSGKSKFIRLVGDSAQRTLSFPAGWKFLHATAPTEIGAGKVALLFLMAFGANDTDVVASYGVQP